MAQVGKGTEKGSDRLVLRTRILLASGDRAEAIALLRELEDHSTSESERVSPLSLAGIYAALGDKEKAVALLEKAYAEREFWLRTLKTDPDWDSLRSDPRFQRLLRQLKLD